MSAPTNAGPRISTGLFEIDLSCGHVFRAGQRMPVQDQPFRVLALLLERPGQVVSREELQARLWPADTYVGFDEGLNTAIRKLRVLFGDSADNPRFIETVPRRGYRFIAPVSEVSAGAKRIGNQNGNAAVAEDVAVPAVSFGLRETEQRTVVIAQASKSPARSRAWLWMLLGSVAALLAVVVVTRTRHDRVPPLPGKSPERHERLAVLPFQNLSNDPSQEYFSDGLTEETITDLGQLSPAQLGVIARTSAMAYKHTDKTVGQIGRELGVDYILEGSVRREGARARVSAQLIRVSDQTHLWAQNYDARDQKDLIEVQNAIGRAIADQVQLKVSTAHRVERAKARPINPEAYDQYLRARFYFNQRMPAANRQSIQFFKKAIAADPSFAPAYAGLALAYNFSIIDAHNSPKVSFPLGREMAIKAIQLDPSQAEAHAALGMEKSLYEFDFTGAKAEFLKAIELDPNSSYAHLTYSINYLSPMRQSAEAISENRKALELDPLSLSANTFMGNTYLYAGDYTRAYEQYQHIVAMAPNFAWGHGVLMNFFEVNERFEAAIDERQKADALFEWTPQQASERAAALRKALRNGGEKAYWKERIAQDLRASKQRSGGQEASFVLALRYAQASNKDEAFEWLKKSYDAREGQELIFLAVDPVWNNLHGDPRFSDLLRRIGLPEPSAIEPPVLEKSHL